MNMTGMEKKILIARSEEGDWYGIYVDGVLKSQGHSLSYSTVLKSLGYDFKVVDISEEIFNQYGHGLPSNETELKLEK